MAIDIKIINISRISPLADYFIVASANNSSQLKAIAEEVEEKLFKEAGISKKHSEGTQTKSWILLDFGDIVIHLFNKEDREFYNIERIWADADFIDVSTLKV